MLSNSDRHRLQGPRTPRNTHIFTWIGGARRGLPAANVATCKPYLDIDATCVREPPDHGSSLRAAPTRRNCAKQIINFVRGWRREVFDERLRRTWKSHQCGSVPRRRRRRGAQPRQRRRTTQRFWKLGDIFHSSPAVVKAPIDAVRCDTGYEKQCVGRPSAARSALPRRRPNPSTNAGLTGASPGRRLRALPLDNRTGSRVVLVGANDGMLHAFDAGDASAATQAGDAATRLTSGTGTELWAFIPPTSCPG